MVVPKKNNVMKLIINFAKDLLSQSLVQQKNIPCLCKIGINFEVHFPCLQYEKFGLVEDWDRKELEWRAPAGAGGAWTHHRCCLISLEPVSDGVYKIEDLSMFYEDMGWLPVLKNSIYVTPVGIWDEE